MATKTKDTAKPEDTPSVGAKISILYVSPTLLSSSMCPHCDELNFAQIYPGQVKTKVLHACEVCENEYFIDLPDLPPLKQEADGNSSSKGSDRN